MSTEHLLGDVGIILTALMGTDDSRRQEAEEHLRKSTVQSPGDMLLLLAQIGAQGVGGFQLDERLLTLILLRRLAFTSLPGLFLNDQHHSASAPFDVIAERTKSRIETVLCAGMRDEMDTRLRKGLGNCIGSWAQESSMRQRPCLAIPPVLLELTTSPHPFHRFTPFQLLNTTPTLLVDSVSDPLPVQQLGGLLVAGLNDPSMDVRVEALKATSSILKEGVTGKEREEVGASLVLTAFQGLPRLPLHLLSHALQPLVDLVSLHPNLFLPSLQLILPYLLSLIAPPATNLPDHSFFSYPPSNMPYEDYEAIANPASEILLTLMEFRRQQVIAWEQGRAGKDMVGLLIARLVVGLADQGEECRDWIEETNLEEEDETYPSYPEEALDRLAQAVDGALLLPAVSEQVQPLLQHPDWRCRYSALVSIASVTEGCVDEVIPRLSDVLSLVSPSSKDPHPRVRYGFLHCLGQLCTDLQGLVQKMYSKQILGICLELLGDDIARVGAHAAACMCNFFNDLEISSPAEYLGDVVQKLLQAFQRGPLYVQEQVLSTISSVSTSAGQAFTSQYRQVMDFLFNILRSPTHQEHRVLVGRAVECASMTGNAVGKKTFANDAVNLAGIMITIQNDCAQPDDPRRTYMMDAWATLARALGTDFEPFLPHVVPPLLKAASFKPSVPPETKISLMQSNEEDAYTAIATTHSDELDDKILAFDNLAIYAYAMRRAFEPWLMPSMELSLEALTFTYSEDVRESAAFLVPGLLQVAKESSAWQSSPQHLEHVFKTLLNAIGKEQDFGFLALLFKSYTDSLHVISTSLPPNLLSQSLKQVQTHLTDLHGLREDRRVQEEYMDEGDREMYLEEQEEEDTCLDHMTRALDAVRVYNGTADGVTQEVDRLLQMAASVRAEGLKVPEG